jgi:NADH:ubiquinone oxidoreductase subunit 6 (subunit J)
MLFYSLEFFPIFFMLIYIGAIIVTTLFVVLTFDLRTEYSSKKVFEPKALFNIFLFYVCSFTFPSLLVYLDRNLLQHGRLSEAHRVEAYSKCLDTAGVHSSFCDTHFGLKGMHRSLYNAVGESQNDIVVISNNLYSSYALLFLILGIILTIALLAALSLLREYKRDDNRRDKT